MHKAIYLTTVVGNNSIVQKNTKLYIYNGAFCPVVIMDVHVSGAALVKDPIHWTDTQTDRQTSRQPKERMEERIPRWIVSVARIHCSAWQKGVKMVKTWFTLNAFMISKENALSGTGICYAYVPRMAGRQAGRQASQWDDGEGKLRLQWFLLCGQL